MTQSEEYLNDPRIPSLDESPDLPRWRVWLTQFGIFGVIAVMLAIGIYAVLGLFRPLPVFEGTEPQWLDSATLEPLPDGTIPKISDFGELTWRLEQGCFPGTDLEVRRWADPVEPIRVIADDGTPQEIRASFDIGQVQFLQFKSRTCVDDLTQTVELSGNLPDGKYRLRLETITAPGALNSSSVDFFTPVFEIVPLSELSLGEQARVVGEGHPK